ncbi:MAG: SDR family oxidoreductase [Burkholderiales bacterium]|nr:SDR family oxidoreductase [Burkholderiales bacterium]
MPTTLITGANRGLGLEFVRQYAEAGWRVLACCRDPKAAADLTDLAGGSGGRVTVHALDVTDPARAAALAAELDGEAIDLLLNNAGVYEREGPLGQLDLAAWERSFRVNTLAPIQLSAALVEHVARSQGKRIVNVTSLMGSIGDNQSGGSYAYRSSKAALNMATVCLAKDLRPRGITCLLLHPGWVKTDMGGPDAPVDVPTSVAGLANVIAKRAGTKKHAFVDFEGADLAW